MQNIQKMKLEKNIEENYIFGLFFVIDLVFVE